MKILVVAHFQNDGSPCAIFIHDQMKAYVELGHQVCAIVPVAFGKKNYQGKRISKRIEKQDIDGVRYLFVRYLSLSKYGEKNFNTKRAIGAIKKTAKSVASWKPDVIHAHTLGFDSEIGVWLKERLTCPLVVTTHGSDCRKLILKNKKEFIRKYCDKVDRIACVSNNLKTEIDVYLTNPQTRVILNGFNVSGVKDSIKKNYTINQTSNLIAQKKIDVTISAIALLKEKYPQMRLTVIGEGVEKENLQKICQQKYLSECVEFLGGLPNDQVMDIMSRSQFFVMPSVREGFGVVYLEAMASGCITIGTEGEGIADLIVSGQNGFLVPPNDSVSIANTIEWCLQNLDKAKEIARKGKQDALAMTWQRNAKEYVELFIELIAKTNKGK